MQVVLRKFRPFSAIEEITQGRYAGILEDGEIMEKTDLGSGKKPESGRDWPDED